MRIIKNAKTNCQRMNFVRTIVSFENQTTNINNQNKFSKHPFINHLRRINHLKFQIAFVKTQNSGSVIFTANYFLALHF